MDIFPFPTAPAPKHIDRPLAIEALRVARSCVLQDCKEHYSPYICDNLAENAATEDLKVWISAQLGSGQVGRLNRYLLRRGHIAHKYHENMPDEDFEKLQRTRAAWIDWMIQELSHG